MASEKDSSKVLQVQSLTAGARRILEVASTLFYQGGIHVVGVDTIAAESGITKRTLYNQFGSKDQLIVAYLQDRHQRWWERMEQRVAEQPESTVLAIFDSYTQDSESSDRGCAFINAAAELPASHPGYAIIRAHKRMVRYRIVDLIHRHYPGIDNPEGVADEVFLLLEGSIVHCGIDGNVQLLERARKSVARLIHE